MEFVGAAFLPLVSQNRHTGNVTKLFVGATKGSVLVASVAVQLPLQNPTLREIILHCCVIFMSGRHSAARVTKPPNNRRYEIGAAICRPRECYQRRVNINPARVKIPSEPNTSHPPPPPPPPPLDGKVTALAVNAPPTIENCHVPALVTIFVPGTYGKPLIMLGAPAMSDIRAIA